jgi:hypothetical protein
VTRGRARQDLGDDGGRDQGSFTHVPVGQLAAVRMVRWLWRRTQSPAGRAFGLGGYCLLLGATQLAALPGSDHIVTWLRLLSGLVLMLAGVSQLWAGVKLRRQRRTKLLQAVVTAVSALERRRCEESSPDQG